MLKPSISILMPVFNAAPFLESCLNSIISQQFLDWELIAVNDHSTDNSELILRQFADSDKRIKVLNNKEKGIIPALRLAFANSKGDFISRMDADDRMPQGKLGLLLDLLKESGPGYVATGKVSYFSDTVLMDGYRRYAEWLNSLVDNDEHAAELFRECVIPSPAWLIARDDFIRCEAFDPNRYPEDYDLVFRFFKHGMQVCSTKQLVHHWRDHSSRTSRNDETYSQNAYFDIKAHYLPLLRKLEGKQLVIWGAGRKGKQLAKKLKMVGLSFLWTCNVESKWGHIIYENKMLSPTQVYKIEHPLFLIAVSGPQDQQKLEEQFKNKGFIKGVDYYFFC
jgi:glycosyltransferase involved in cell wall biosynthesis